MQLSGGTVRKGFLEKADFELGLGDSLNPGSPVIVLRAGPLDPLLSLSHSCNFTFVCMIIQFVTISPHKTLCSVRAENRLDFPRLCIRASTQVYSCFTMRKQYVQAPATSINICWMYA